MKREAREKKEKKTKKLDLRKRVKKSKK